MGDILRTPLSVRNYTAKIEECITWGPKHSGIFDRLISNWFRIEYYGSQVSFSHSGDLISFSTPNYFSGNETYGRAIGSALTQVRGIDNYLGVIGGLDPALIQLCCLSAGNSLRSARLVDMAAEQAFYAMPKLISYDRGMIHDLEDGLFADLVASKTIGVFQDYPVRLPHITLSVGKIENEVASVAVSGIYFIYVSNAFQMNIFENGPAGNYVIKGHAGLDKTGSLLNSILANKNFVQGSLIMISEANSHVSIILQKSADGFSVFSFVSKDANPNTGLEHHSHTLDLAAQIAFVNDLASLKRLD